MTKRKKEIDTMVKQIEENRKSIGNLSDKLQNICKHEQVTQRKAIWLTAEFECDTCGRGFDHDTIPKGTIVCKMTCNKKR